jgi:hypothetical protein
MDKSDFFYLIYKRKEITIMTKDETYKKILWDIIKISSMIGWNASTDSWKKLDPLRMALNYKINKAIEMNKEENK